MPLLQVQTCCPSLLPNLQNCFNAVLSRYTPISAICERKTGPCARACATRRTNSRLETYCCLPREQRVWGLLVVSFKSLKTLFQSLCIFPSDPSFCLLLVDSHLVQLNLHLLLIWLQVVLDVCPIVRPGSGVSLFFRPFFGVPASDSDSSGSWSVSTSSPPVFLAGLAILRKEESLFCKKRNIKKGLNGREESMCGAFLAKRGKILLRIQN